MKIKRLFTLAASLATCLLTFAQTPWDGSVATEFAGGDGTQESPYEVATPAQLALIAQKVNARDELTGVFFKQTADIDLNGSEELQWTPISNQYNVRFGGNYDGAGHRIKNFYFHDTTGKSSTHCALFGLCTGTSSISGIIIDGTIITANGFGGMVMNSAGTIRDCVSFLNISIEGSGGSRCGGIVATNSGTVERCIFAGKSYGGWMFGGIAASNSGTVRECLNLGQIDSKTTSQAATLGGITSENSGTIENCINAGSIYCIVRSGGITAMQIGTLRDCINVGPVYGQYTCGAILGSGEGNSHLYYDVQTASGLLTGEKYFDSNENKRITTESFISGNAQSLTFTDASKWQFTDGLYPQLTAFSTSDNKLVRQLSALGAVPVIATDYEVWAALTKDLKLRDTITYQGGSDQLIWTSDTPDIISISGSTAKFTEPGEDSDMVFTATISGTDIKRVFRHHHYEVFSTIEIPEHTTKGDVRTYKIKNIGNLAWVCALANGLKLAFSDDNDAPAYSTFQNCKLEITDDIDFSGHNWVPIAGLNSEMRYFSGSIEGNGHAIKNLTINRTKDPNIALIARLYGGEGIHNLRLTGGSVTSNGDNTSSLVGSIYFTDMTDCINESCTVNGYFNVGGLVSEATGCTIARCANLADVTASYYYAGGLCGIFNSNTSKYSEMSECFNTGAINATSGYVGGLVAINGGYSSIEHCYNMGEITADGENIGGIACIASVNSFINNCYNAGAVRKPKGFIGKILVGEIIGSNEGGTFKSNYYDATTGVAGGAIAGNDGIGATGMSTEELQSEETIAKLGATYFCADSNGLNNGYPVLSWYQAYVGVNPTITDNADSNELSLRHGIISCNAPCTDLTLYNISGRIAAYTPGASIDVSSLGNGLYIAVATTADGRRLSKKIMLNK